MDIDIKLNVVVAGLDTSTARRHEADLRFSLKTVMSAALEVLEAEAALGFLFPLCPRNLKKIHSAIKIYVNGIVIFNLKGLKINIFGTKLCISGFSFYAKNVDYDNFWKFF